ncbi:MAG: hypothetical protein HZB41_10315 [Ignavibacteriae bacterium]|nr:hypothetical protein [Ignavibacteriota bacterium]
MKNINIFLLLLLSIIFISCNDNSVSNPDLPDDGETYIDNDTTIINIDEHFKGSILNTYFDWENRNDRRQAYHGWEQNFETPDTGISFDLGLNTYPIYVNDYALFINSPTMTNWDYNKVKQMFSPGAKILSENGNNFRSYFRLYVRIADEVEGTGNIKKSREFLSYKGSQKDCYFKILSRYIIDKNDHYLFKLKLKLKIKLYNSEGNYAGTIESSSLVLGVIVNKSTFK